jgi:hypothetical protein
LEYFKILIFITVDIIKQTAKKKIKRADQILPEGLPMPDGYVRILSVSIS